MWNTDMYGVDANKEGARAYYDSLFQLYASWGVDYVKVDDLARPYAREEIELISGAIERCGRPMVLSISPGPAPFEQAEHVKNHANLWRLTDDFWDDWDFLRAAFATCAQWCQQAGPGHWPDADMLPLGLIGIRGHYGGERMTRFTRDEQVMLMTLWCIARSPLMFGGNLPANDTWTLNLLTNPGVLRLLSHSHQPEQHQLDAEHLLWTARDDEDGSLYLAAFNLGETACNLTLPPTLHYAASLSQVRDLWSGQEIVQLLGQMPLAVPAHGARLLKFSSKTT
jgi:hypothetical protein